MTNTKVKICCISSLEEALLAIDYGADAIGLVGHMPSGPGIISDKLIANISSSLPIDVDTFLLTSETNAAEIIAHYKKVLTTTIQIVDSIDLKDYAVIREALPKVKLVQVVHVINERSIKDAKLVSSHVDAILLDSGTPNLETKILGGTGNTHNWNLSKRIVAELMVPVFLAGGLNASNVQQAIELVRPNGVDLCTGVRTNGKLDEKKLNRFFNAVRLGKS